jgi:Uncharacterized protein conserved in bacteria (DUF2155)
MIRALVGAVILGLSTTLAVAQEDVPLTDEYGNLLDREGAAGDTERPPPPQVVTARGGILRVLDKIDGSVTDLELLNGDSRALGSLTIALSECRYPSDNPAGNAYALMNIYYRDATEPLFSGWMIAASPAVSAMQHPRYDVWVLRCITS